MATTSDKSETLAFLMTNRAPGKRQIRIIPESLNLDFPEEENEEDDEDFSLGSGSDSDEEDDTPEDEDEEEVKEEEEPEGEEEVEVVAGPSASPEPSLGLVCCLCLNWRQNLDNSDLPDVIQCDKCGVVVHEGCYGVAESESIGSECSTAPTEPWFCEPCLAGQLQPVFCDFCPLKGGALKRMNCGRWVHLSCALYTPGVTFGDYDVLSAVSVFEMNYARFGSRACHACQDGLVARFGIVTKCDAGLCKLHFHISCAQKLGLLVDSTNESEMEQADPRYLLCPAHSNKDTMMAKRRRYKEVERHWSHSCLMREERQLNGREQEKMDAKRWAFNTRFQKLNLWKPNGQEKWRRLVHSSAEFFEKMQKKSELTAGISLQEYEREFRVGFTPDMVGKINMPPAFSGDFVSYYQEREKFIANLSKRVGELKKTTADLKQTQTARQAKYDQIRNKKEKVVNSATEDHAALSDLIRTLNAVSPKLKLRPPPTPKGSPEVVRRVSDEPGPSTSKKGLKTTSTEKKKPKKLLNHVLVGERLEFHECATCKTSRDQHLLTQCDTCKRHYHLACLDPPLLKMPHRSAVCGWECSGCCEADDSDSTGEDKVDMDAPRRLRTQHKPTNRFQPDEIHFKKKKKKEKSISPKKVSSSPPNLSPVRSRPHRRHSVTASPPKLSIETRKKGGMEESHRKAENWIPAPKEEPPTLPTKRGPGRPPKKKSKQDSPDLQEKVLIFVDPPIQAANVDVETSCIRTQRMRYPRENLEKAVSAVWNGSMSNVGASEFYKVPRSTIGRRITLIKGGKATPPLKQIKQEPASPRRTRSSTAAERSFDERIRDEINSVLEAQPPAASLVDRLLANPSPMLEAEPKLGVHDYLGANGLVNGGPPPILHTPPRRRSKIIRVEDLDL